MWAPGATAKHRGAGNRGCGEARATEGTAIWGGLRGGVRGAAHFERTEWPHTLTHKRGKRTGVRGQWAAVAICRSQALFEDPPPKRLLDNLIPSHLIGFNFSIPLLFSSMTLVYLKYLQCFRFVLTWSLWGVWTADSVWISVQKYAEDSIIYKKKNFFFFLSMHHMKWTILLDKITLLYWSFI